MLQSVSSSWPLLSSSPDGGRSGSSPTTPTSPSATSATASWDTDTSGTRRALADGPGASAPGLAADALRGVAAQQLLRQARRHTGPEGLPVLAFPAVGYAWWVLPHVSILDTHGLNDRHVARTPIREGSKRAMAHDRQPPEGYLECFRPNVRVLPGRRIEVATRADPLTAEDIQTCEAFWARRIATLQKGES